MLNADRNAQRQSNKWEVFILLVTIGLFAAGLAFASVFSFLQTNYAFLDLNDPTVVVGGFVIGNGVSVFLSFIFQYGQNAALYLRRHFTNNKPVFHIMGFPVTDRMLWLSAWFLCAGIDAGTNCFWLASRPATRTQLAQGMAWWVYIKYVAMVALVGVEELLGKAIQAFVRVQTQWRQILASERRISQATPQPASGTVSASAPRPGMPPMPHTQLPGNGRFERPKFPRR